MGIDEQSLTFLCYANKFFDFKKTITIGRQSLNVNEFTLKKLIPVDAKYKQEVYVDQLLKNYFKSTIVDSIDKSSYEDATIIHDMNLPIPDNLKNKYDTVIDSGTLEHVYDIPQALENVSFLCRTGGQIIHILPANNFCGHGFWQISPELFFSLYSDENGYEDTEVFLAKVHDSGHNFYKVIKPKNGNRVNIYSKDELFVCVRTIKRRTKFIHSNIQQSDYVYLWNSKVNSEYESNSWLINFIHNHYLILNLSRKLYSKYYQSKLIRKNALSKSNVNLIRVNLSKLNKN